MNKTIVLLGVGICIAPANSNAQTFSNSVTGRCHDMTSLLEITSTNAEISTLGAYGDDWTNSDFLGWQNLSVNWNSAAPNDFSSLASAT